MHKGIVFVVLLSIFLGACASGKDTAQSAAVNQPQASRQSGSASQNEELSAGKREVQDSRIIDLSGIDASEEADWINPKNPPELKRKYHKGFFSIVLPEDMYPAKTNIYTSAGLFKFRNTDAFMYIFSPRGVDASTFLDINLNTLNPSQAKGYHDMVIDLKGNILNMAYRFDGSNDGYVRYVEIKKTYQPAGMLVSALIARDVQSYTKLLQEYQTVLSTLKHESE
jgi:hypothetical protein